jgi:hypothetical protein
MLRVRMKSSMFKRFRSLLYSSPSAKTAMSLTCAGGTGIFSNTLVTEMTTPQGILWSSFYSTVSFYLVSGFFILTFFYHRYLYVHEADVQNFRDTDYCLAYARSKLLPEQVEYYRQKIREGQLDDLNSAMDEIKRVLK